MNDIPRSDGFISLCIEAVLYGLFLQSLFCCARVFVRWKQRRWGMYFIAATLSSLVTLDISLAITQLLGVLECCSTAEGAGLCVPHTIPWYNIVKVRLY